MNINLIIKTLIILVTGMLSIGCVSTQPYTPVELTNVINVEGSNQKILFDKSRQWFSEYFVSGESVIDYEDKQTGTIIGNGISSIGSDTFGIIEYTIHYTIRVDTKDGKLRIKSTVIKHTNTDSTNGTYDTNYVPDDRKLKAQNKIDSIINNLESYINNSNDSNW
jgi:hypothetical protein